MGLSSSELQTMVRNAKASLTDNWLKAAIATLIYSAIISVASYTYVLQLILVGPLTFGLMLYIMCLVDTRVSDFNLLFKGIDRFVQTMIAGIVITLITGLGMMLLFVPGIIAALGLSMTYFIMADNKEISGIDAIQESWNMMKGHKMNLFSLWLQLIGWWLLCIITIGIAYFWVMPYYTAAKLNFYRRLRLGPVA